ncbi:MULTISPECIES: GDP-L-fucose synthase family protein [Robiginitalea]|nr:MULTISPECIES: GDP-L-fucose synthase [Robiginitalea]MDC6353194.1 GDP-L-fucose synthase [Robiginitalea sp. PM2]MDC6373639.1 GDP-L-fucose synthase [Robiginitalea sp. SP8]
MHKQDKIFVAGHRGMVGSAIWSALESKGYTNLIGRSSRDLDLRDQAAVNEFFQSEKPEFVIDAAARVGGILANDTYPYQFLMENLSIQNNLIQASHESGVTGFIFLGSSCIYPKLAPQPLGEDSLLTGPLEPTNQWYAIAKIAGVKLCESIRRQYGKYYISLMPTNLYGPNDNFDLKTSHVLPAMIRKFHEAKLADHKSVDLWGSGKPMREFLHVDDLADAVVYAMENKLPHDLYNVGTGRDLTIRSLAKLIQEIVGHKGAIHWDMDKPDGTPRKLMDVSRLKESGWTASIGLEDGIRSTYDWFLKNQDMYKQVRLS